MKYYIVIAIIPLVILSCGKKAKVITPTETSSTINKSSEPTGVFDKRGSKKVESNSSSNSQFESDDIHHIEVLEVLPTEKYVYLKVTENQESYWVATGKQKVEVGAKYFFKNGLLKTNFESKEYNRVFDKVYLVSKLVPENHAHENSSIKTVNQSADSKVSSNKDIPRREGSISIKEVIENASTLEGKEIQVTGECTKLNANIMGRNWIHLKDGSNDDFDFVITSDQAIPEGHIVTLKGRVGIDRDFDSGYRYDLLIENASIVHE